MQKTTIYIQGMHCASCEIILEKELKKIEGIDWCNVSHKKGTAKIKYSGEKPMQKIQETIGKCGYEIADGQKTTKPVKAKNSFDDYMSILMTFVLIGLIAWFLKKLELSRFLPDIGDNMNLFIALLLGIVASLSTCLALTGGLVMSFSSVYKPEEDKKHKFLAKANPHIYFHIGRIGGFALLGGLLGAIGSKINYSTTFTGYITIFIAMVMLYIGLQILNITPSITKLGFHLPKAFSKKIHSLEGNNHHLAPILIGALTFFLPCGFTQSMQLAAVGSQSFIQGALIMGIFAIGTMPVLLSIGIGSTYAQDREFKSFKKIIGVIIIFFAIYSLNSGLILSGSKISLNQLPSSGSGEIVETIDGKQIVKMDVDWSFVQDTFKVKKGVPVRWEINGINLSGCSNEIVIPELKIRKKLSKGINIVEFTPEKSGTLPFSCWMGMLGGKFIVTD
jgi:uncharacterized protein